ncbi:TIGR00730 family Rossman fold protein, partial [Escherichia coli]|nr:TIGR00730 family Rossman fold protein [Escherichia coli]
SDAIVVLPGGAGSLDEFFEVVTWRQLGLHSKPILVLNTNGYWNPLKALIENVVGQGFAEANLHDFAEFLPDVPALTRRLQAALS